MAVQKEIWVPDIIETLFKDNAFANHCVNRDDKVLAGKVVHIPQSGGPSGWQRNRTNLPAPVVRRGDSDITYTLDEFTSNPAHIPNADTVELSYDKRASVIKENIGELKEGVMEWLLYNWGKNVASGNIVKTTGTSTSGAALPPSGTGNRKIITEADIRKAATVLNNQNLPQTGRYLLLTADQLNELQSDNNLKYAFQNVVNLREGTIARLYTFDIMVRSSVLVMDGSDAVKLPGAAGATDDNVAALFWHESAVERALGEVTMFERLDDPLYYGDIYSFLVRSGGRACRADNKGYGVICEDA